MTTRRLLSAFFFAALLPLLTAPLVAQDLNFFSRHHTYDGAAESDRLGWSVAGTGDVNQNGFADVIVGARWPDPGERNKAGSASIHNCWWGGNHAPRAIRRASKPRLGDTP